MDIRVGILTAPHIAFEQREKTFVLKNVRIGIGFHWDRYEDQEFAGALEIKPTPVNVLRTATGSPIEQSSSPVKGGEPWEVAINTIDLEDYLCSVISSEMNANSPMELLKAHAIISRSWAMRAIAKPNHEGYHVCADDHCQRYEGLRRMNERAVQAVRETKGLVLTYDQMVNDQMVNEICDCRYYKCCGGRTEVWRTCWEDIDVPYIQSVECPYCGRVSAKTLRLVLNDYDQETHDFHDWQVSYTADELSDIIRTKSGIDFGEIIDLIPLHRGASGRIDQLRIVGTKHTEIIGKELKIRLWLSRNCLYSSWFEVAHENGVWTLTGHGWGHGAGLCQIGAAQMAEEGFSHEQILAHYYAGTRISTPAK